MTVRAAELSRVTRTDLDQAVVRVSRGELPESYEASTKFDILLGGESRIPPKPVVALALESSLGRLPHSREFSGGEVSTSTRLLIDLGFEIATKRSQVADLDCHFFVGTGPDGLFLVIEARGSNKGRPINRDYFPGFEAILRGLREYDVVLERVEIDSTVTRKMPVQGRRVDIEGYRYPIRLADLEDVLSLRLAITSAAATTGKRDPSSKGGNPTKRLRLMLSVSDEPSLMELRNSLGDSTLVGSEPQAPKEFKFSAGPPPEETGTTVRIGSGRAFVRDLHRKIQARLYEQLVDEFGFDCVSGEQHLMSGHRADLMVDRGDCFDLYEVKTASSPRQCVREAMGQLLEYAYWLGSPTVDRIYVVGPYEADTETTEFVDHIGDRFGLPLEYLAVPIEEGE